MDLELHMAAEIVAFIATITILSPLALFAFVLSLLRQNKSDQE